MRENGKRSVRHLHENEETLSELEDLYKETIETARQIKQRGGSIAVFYLNAEGPVEKVGQEVFQIILDHLTKN